MKFTVILLCLGLVSVSFAANGMKFSFQNEDLTKIIDTYSKATGQKFVIDESVRGKGLIVGAQEVTAEEAFNLLSSTLATAGFAILKQGDTMVVRSARNAQRDLIETTDTLPPLKPERMITFIYTFKNIAAESVNRDLRILSSKDGEMSVYPPRNQIIISDWISNIHRVHQIFMQIDQPADPNALKLAESYHREQSLLRADRERFDKEKPNNHQPEMTMEHRQESKAELKPDSKADLKGNSKSNPKQERKTQPVVETH